MSEELRRFQEDCVQSYKHYLEGNPYPFSLCVLTARDAQQKMVFEKQLDAKRLSGTIPLNLEFLVVCDRPGTIGSGTATVYVLEDLKNRYGSLSELNKRMFYSVFKCIVAAFFQI
jgi:hypothetical protein